jgi:acyl-CoA thioesterase-1
VLGDSLAVSPSMAEGFPAQLQPRIDRAGLGWRITNASVTGDTTADGLRRLPPLLTSDAGVLIVALGANDGIQGVDIAVIDRNLSAIIESAVAHNIRVLLCGMESPPTRGLNYSIAFHALFPALAQRYSIPLVPFLLAGVALVPEFNGPDLVHPNAAGAQRIADTVWPYLQPLLLEIRTTALPGSAGLQPRVRRGPERAALPAERGEHFADRLTQHGVGDVVEGCGLRVDDDDACAGGLCLGHGAGDGIYLQARANREQHVRLRGGAQSLSDYRRYERLSERDGGALQDPATPFARRIVFARPHAIEHRRHRSSPIALHAHHVVHGAMDFDHLVR